MFEKWKKSGISNGETGEIMIEAIIIFPLVLFILLMLISLGFLLYQHALITEVANETAIEIAQTYKYTDMSSSSAAITDEMTAKIKRYRYWLHGNELLHRKQQLAEEYGTNRLAKSSMARAISEPSINLQIKTDNIGRKHIVVDVSCQYEILLGGILDYFGMNGKPIFHATACAEIEDIGYYMSMIRLTRYASGIGGGTKVVKTVDSVLNAIKTFKDILEK